MRNFLFWKTFFLFSLIFIVLIIILSQLNLLQLSNIPLQTFVLLFFGIEAAAAISLFLITSSYIQPIQYISEHLKTPSRINDIFLRFQSPPKEIRSLSISLLNLDKKQHEEKLRYLAEKRKFSSILRNMNDGILIVDHNAQVNLINQSACEIFQIEEGKALNHSLAVVLRHYKVQQLWEKTRTTKQQGMISFETSAGARFILCIATPLEPELPENTLFLFQDITRIRRLEIIRRDFVSNVSHELRTPLASLKVLAETLQEGALHDPPAAQKFLGNMVGEIDNLTQIVEELLELSRIESGKVPLEKKWIKPYILIQTAANRMTIQAERAGLKLEFDCPKTLPSIFVDPTRIGRVFINLLHNAIKFSKPGGFIYLEAKHDKDVIIFSVKDTGIGIQPKDFGRIFERFYKSDQSRSNPGTGLGLSISKHLVEAHGGKIWVDSSVGSGSIFSFSVPLS